MAMTEKQIATELDRINRNLKYQMSDDKMNQVCKGIVKLAKGLLPEGNEIREYLIKENGGEG